MKLIYRGQILDYQPKSLPSYQKPQALNWRYQIPGESYEPIKRAARLNFNPKAVNWRFWVTECPSF